jgi:hypothetical protein
MTIDERLQFLVQSTESLHQTCQELHATVQEQGRQLRELDERERKHWRRVTRALEAALEAWLEEDGDEEEPAT